MSAGHKKIISLLIVFTMAVSSFGVITFHNTNSVFAETESNVVTTADPDLNTITLPNQIKHSKYFKIHLDGDRFNDIMTKNRAYRTGDAGKNIFIQGEEYFEPGNVNITSVKVDGANVRTNFSYPHGQYGFRTTPYYLNLRYNAGKYIIKVDFKKYKVFVPFDDAAVRFDVADTLNYTKTATFYVDSKVKFVYNKRYGKLSKANRTRYMSPGLKYGKLAKPKAKKGYKFVGWYTKPNGGKKVRASTKIPTKNYIFLYARYKKK